MNQLQIFLITLDNQWLTSLVDIIA